MAPKTSERTSFQKDVGAYSRTVVKAEFLNIEVRESQSFHPYRIRRFFLYLIDCSCYYVILEILGKIHKIIAVSAHAHYEIAVRVGVFCASTSSSGDTTVTESCCPPFPKYDL